MNCEAAKLAEARRQEVEALGGLPAYRPQALQNLRLKTVVKASAWSKLEARSGRWGRTTLACRRLPPPAAAVQAVSLPARWAAQPAAQPSCCTHPPVQESHATPVQALAFNHCDPQLGNLFATVGADQATGAAAVNATLPPCENGLLLCGRQICQAQHKHGRHVAAHCTAHLERL